MQVQKGIRDSVKAMQAMAPIVSLKYLPTQREAAIAQLMAEVRSLGTSDGFSSEAYFIYWSCARGFELIERSHSGRTLLFPIPQIIDEVDGQGEVKLRPHPLRALAAPEGETPKEALKRVAALNVPAVYILDGIAEFMDASLRGLALQHQTMLDRLWGGLLRQEALVTVTNEDGQPLNTQYEAAKPGDTLLKQMQPGQSVRWIVVGGINPVLPEKMRDRVRLYRYEIPKPHETRQIIEANCAALERAGFADNLSAADLSILTSKMQLLPEEEIGTVLRIAATKYSAIDQRAIAAADDERRRLLEYLDLQVMDAPKVPVGGMANLKAWVKRSLEPSLKLAIDHPDEVPQRKGLLMVGPPGTGKTLMAAQIAEDLGILGIKFNVGEMLSSGLGDSEGKVRATLEMAKALAPCILFVDELDKQGLDKGNDGRSDGGVVRRILGNILSFMTEPKERPVFVIFTANRTQNLPSELTRAGRVDKVFLVDLPSENARADILKIHLSSWQHSLSDEDIKKVAIATPDYSGSELEDVVANAWDFAYERSQNIENIIISAEDCMKAIAEVVPLAVRNPEEVASMRQQEKFAAPAEKVETKSRKRQVGKYDRDISPVI